MGVNLRAERSNSPRVRIDLWTTLVVVSAVLLLTPLAAVFLGIFEASELWPHLAQTVLKDYLLNTGLLICGVGVVSIIFALPTAWLVANYNFPLRDFWKWALVMPLAVPTFAASFAYYDLLDASIPLVVAARTQFGFEASQWVELIIRYGLLITLLSSVLYPYLFLSLRTAFTKQQSIYIEASRMLGKRTRSIFFRIALPMSRPMLIAGLSLIIMEVVNDYGAVNMFGVPTLTEGIFRTWFGLEDRASGLRLAALVAVIIFLILALEAWQRRRLRYIEGSQANTTQRRVSLHGYRAWIACLLCASPVLIGFAYPVAKLSYWTYLAIETVRWESFLGQAGRSALLASATALLLSLFAFFLAFGTRIQKRRHVKTFVKSSTFGYALPSVVTGVGVMLIFGWLDQLADGAFLISGSLYAIGFAYIVRFMTVAYGPLSAGMLTVCGSLHEASQTLGRSRWQSFASIHWPMLRLTILACATLVFIDIMKELPLTLILRPSDFETLATFAFGFAKEGQIYDCALPSLLIIALGVFGLLVLESWIEKETT